MPQFAVPVAAEAAVATTMTAAEIAAAQAAAAHAAQVTAAQVLAAEQAAALAAQQATAAAATNTVAANAANVATNQSVLNAIGAGGAPVPTAVAAGGAPVSTAGGIADLGFKSLAEEVGTKTGIETLSTANDQVLQAFQNAQANTPSMTGEQFLNNSFAGPAVAPPVAPPPPPAPTLPSLGGPGTGYQGTAVQIGSGSSATPYTPAELQIMQGSVPSPASTSVNPLPQDRMLNYGIETQGIKAPLNQTATFNLTGSGTPPAAKPGMFEEFTNMSLPNKLLTGMMGATAYEMLNKPDPYEKEKYKSTFKPGLYTGYTPVQPTPYQPRYAVGGIADLGGYSDGGRMLKGPGDGMSDDIPATIANKQPARLANEEFVVPADVVSHLGNGSSEAGAKVLYKMMERVRKARTGNKKQGKQINPDKYLA